MHFQHVGPQKLWTFNSKTWDIHPCPKMHQCWTFGENTSQDIVLSTFGMHGLELLQVRVGLQGRMSCNCWSRFLQPSCPACCPTNSIKAHILQKQIFFMWPLSDHNLYKTYEHIAIRNTPSDNIIKCSNLDSSPLLLFFFLLTEFVFALQR